MSSATAVVDRWARETEARLRNVFRQAAQDVAENVSVGGAYSPGTPFDTGFARAKWGAALNGAPATLEVPPKGLQTGDLESEGQAAASAMNLVIATADLGDSITLYNNTRYLPSLEDGSTPITSAGHHSGWIAQTVHAWPAIVAQAVARLRGAR